MTLQEQAEVRRSSVGTKVLMMGLGVFAVLGSFWTIVWFIRAYVEAPRVNNAPMALAIPQSTPMLPAGPTAPPAPIAEPKQPAGPPSVITAGSMVEPAQTEAPAAASALSDRWLPIAPEESVPAPAEPMTTSTIPAALPTAPGPEPPADEVAETSVPAISGTAPLPRRKPTQTAAVRPRAGDPPLPRPRPDGPAPQSVWTAVPTTDDRYQAGQ